VNGVGGSKNRRGKKRRSICNVSLERAGEISKRPLDYTKTRLQQYKLSSLPHFLVFHFLLEVNFSFFLSHCQQVSYMVPLYCSWIQFVQNKEPYESLYLQYTQVRLRPSVRPSQLLKLYEKEFVSETFKNTDRCIYIRARR